MESRIKSGMESDAEEKKEIEREENSINIKDLQIQLKFLKIRLEIDKMERVMEMEILKIELGK